jgi:type II secretory pathway pseudopilin PulG
MKKRWKGITLVEVLLAVSMSTIVVAVAYSVLQSALQQVETTASDVDLRVEKRILQQTLQTDLMYSSEFNRIEGEKHWMLRTEKGTVVEWAFDEDTDTVTRKEGENLRYFLSGHAQDLEIHPEGISLGFQMFSVAFQAQGESESYTVSSRNRTLVRSLVETFDAVDSKDELIYFDLLTGEIQYNFNKIKKYYTYSETALPVTVDYNTVKWIRVTKNGKQDGIVMEFYNVDPLVGGKVPSSDRHYPNPVKVITLGYIATSPYFDQSGNNLPFAYFLNMKETTENPWTFAVINDTQNALWLKFQGDQTRRLDKGSIVYLSKIGGE